MQVNQLKLQGLLHTPNQFVIPLFQRYYAWRRKDWERLWQDVVTLLESEPQRVREHFLGSIVCVEGVTQPGKVPQYPVIDGQQRLLTLVILLCAIRDEARARGLDSTAERIQESYLIHRFEEGLDRYRLLPRQRDRQAAFDLTDGKPVAHDGRVTEAYRYFAGAIRAYRPDSAPVETIASDAEIVQRLLATVTARLTMVTITLKDENPFAIFATLNSTGQPLEQSDLIRNHVFMKVPIELQDAFDEKYWQPLEAGFDGQGSFPAIQLTEFFRDFLMRNGSYVQPDRVYLEFQGDEVAKRLDTSPVEVVETLSRHAGYYRWIHRPATAPDPDVRRELSRLRRLRLTTANPLLLHLFDLRHQGIIGAGDLIECLRAIQSFVVRRTITQATTRPYSRLFPAAIKDLRKEDVLGSLRSFLARRGWPADGELGEALASFPIYTRATDTARLLLLALEESEQHKEPVDVAQLLNDNKLQIEHVMPQTLGDSPHGDAWRHMLGPEWDRVHSRLLHTLGNLTLTGYNQPLSNSSYEVKRQELAKSHLELNRYFANSAIWEAEAIRRRGAHLAVRLAEIWPRPLLEGEQPAAGAVEWTAAELRELWNGLTARCQRALAAIATRPHGCHIDEVAAALELPSNSVAGVLSSVGHQMRKLPNHQWPYGWDGQLREFTMLESIATIVSTLPAQPEPKPEPLVPLSPAELMDLWSGLSPNCRRALTEIAKRPEGYLYVELLEALGVTGGTFGGWMSSVGHGMRRFPGKQSPLRWTGSGPATWRYSLQSELAEIIAEMTKPAATTP
ncbi:MAG: DUF262 domain-containing protein [Chloroflexi bacterium]|nr:DUF262 domain-containing protein [Chloroflexota bacterium]